MLSSEISSPSSSHLKCDSPGQATGRLFGLLCRLTFAQSHSGAADVLVDEFDAGSFESLPHNFQCCAAWFVYAGF
jgi:hypothetical protein